MSVSKFLTIFGLGLVVIVAAFNFFSKTTLSTPLLQSLDLTSLEKTIHTIQIEEIEMSKEDEYALPIKSVSQNHDLPDDVNRTAELFHPYPPVLPIVETVTYVSRVSWLTGRSAYLGDYASHYHTSKHFISRSLHGVGNYLSDVVSKGNQFNVFRLDKKIEFHLILDLSRLKLWLYCVDKSDNQKILLKTYVVCAGKLDSRKASGSLTPLGTFALGNDFAVYQEGVKGIFQGSLNEMVTIFGTRWISFGREIEKCTGSSKGLGLQGVPWKHTEGGKLVENRDCIGSYESSGCIRLLTEDIEELYAILVSKPSFIHIVKDFIEAKLPIE